MSPICSRMAEFSTANLTSIRLIICMNANMRAIRFHVEKCFVTLVIWFVDELTLVRSFSSVHFPLSRKRLVLIEKHFFLLYYYLFFIKPYVCFEWLQLGKRPFTLIALIWTMTKVDSANVNQWVKETQLTLFLSNESLPDMFS